MSRPMSVDPHVYDLAAGFVDDILEDATVTVTAEQRRAYVQRGAEAMQRAIEDTCSVIEAELLEAS
jgi:hypothetical protein